MKRITLLTIALLSLLGTIQAQTRAIWDTISSYTITFEESYQSLSIPQGSLWQVGTPSKGSFNQAHSPQKALMTDSVNPYPVNQNAYFDIFYTESYFFQYGFQMQLQFSHKFDTDTMLDGGYITVSYDKGLTWYNVIEDQTYSFGNTPADDWNDEYNIYSTLDTLVNGQKGFSGRRTEWGKVNLSWYIIPARGVNCCDTDTTIIRFNFVSDGIDNNREGWMIDDIKMYSVDLGSAIEKVSLPEQKLFFPNPANDYIFVEMGATEPDLAVEIYELTGKLIKSFPLVETEKGLDISELEKGLYFVKIGTETQKLIIE